MKKKQRRKSIFTILFTLLVGAGGSIAVIVGLFVADARSGAGADPLRPKIFQSSSQAEDGDIIYIQGANFDATTRVSLSGGIGEPIGLSIVNQVSTSWLAVQLPAKLPSPALVSIVNQHGSSPTVRLNAAQPQHLDATEIVTGGAFRILGRALKVSGAIPSVTIDGRAAAVDWAASDDTMLVATAPPDLAPTGNAVVVVDNRNGTGGSALDRPVKVVEGSGDPLHLGVGWGAGFTFATRVVDAKAACDGSTDDSQVIGDAVAQASSGGGGVVKLPAGTCRVAKTINLAPKVVLRGEGSDATILRYDGNYPLYGVNLDLVGLEDLQLLNSGPVPEGLVWKGNTRSFIRRAKLKMGVSRQWFLTSNRDFLFDHNEIEQTGSYDMQNPYRFDNTVGLVFSNNHSTNAAGSPTFQSVHDSLFLNNHFTRDAITQNETEVVAHHGFVLDFSSRISLVGNTFDVINGPITNKLRNDGETILVEGGGAVRTENVGSVETATPDSVTDHHNASIATASADGLPENAGIAIVSGTGAGQARHVVKYDKSTMSIDRDWDVIPDTTSKYSTFTWGLENCIIKGNFLIGNPRGIWLYQSAVRNIVVADNHISEGGGIFLRAYQNLSQKMFTPQWNVAVTGNQITNTSGRWMSHVIVADVSTDAGAYGIGELGIEIRRNRLVANVPNVASSEEDYASREGFSSLVHVEGANLELNATPNILGTIFQNNTCLKCATGFLIGTGNFGTILSGNQPGPGDHNFLSDQRSNGSMVGPSSGTLVR